MVKSEGTDLSLQGVALRWFLFTSGNDCGSGEGEHLKLRIFKGFEEFFHERVCLIHIVFDTFIVRKDNICRDAEPCVLLWIKFCNLHSRMGFHLDVHGFGIGRGKVGVTELFQDEHDRTDMGIAVLVNGCKIRDGIFREEFDDFRGSEDMILLSPGHAAQQDLSRQKIIRFRIVTTKDKNLL